MKRIIGWSKLILCFLALFQPALSEGIKTLNAPADLKIDGDAYSESIINNLSREEIFAAMPIFIIEDSIFLPIDKPAGIIKLSLEGKVLNRIGRQGAGPAEYIWPWSIRTFKSNIAVMDQNLRKLVIYNKKLEFLTEIRYKPSFFNFIVDKFDRLIFFSNPNSDYYFEAYSGEGKFSRRFAKKVSSPRDRAKKLIYDDVSNVLYIHEENGIWASFKNRYDLRYFKDEKLTMEIKAETGFFKGEEKNMGGREIVVYKDIALHLARIDNKLFYFFRKNSKTYCDIIDLAGLKFVRRVVFKSNYSVIHHYKGAIFYALCYDKNDEEDVLLVKIIMDLKK